MANPKSTLERLIEEHGGVLVRKKKHKVYRFPNGSVFTVSSTPECSFAYDNALSLLKNLLGINPPDRGSPGERREKRAKQKSTVMSGSSRLSSKTVNSVPPFDTWKEKLAMAVTHLTPLDTKGSVVSPRKFL